MSAKAVNQYLYTILFYLKIILFMIKKIEDSTFDLKGVF